MMAMRRAIVVAAPALTALSLVGQCRAQSAIRATGVLCSVVTLRRIDPTQAVPGSCRAAGTVSEASSSVSIGIVGFGLVARELAQQLEKQRASLRCAGTDVNIVAVARSRYMELSTQGEDVIKAMTADSKKRPTDLNQFGDFMHSSPGQRVIVDCTADDAPAELYASWLSAGISVVTPNKRAGSGSIDRYRQVREAARAGGSRFLYETTVGAGLPILSTLQDLLRTGDVVHKVEGIFSGTLSFLFNDGGRRPFSAVVREASELGFTEPDPREDLNGVDVQRKVAILARECGVHLELSDIPVESLVPKDLESWSPSEAERAEGLAISFVRKLEPYDEVMAQRMAEAESKGEVLRYVGVIDVANGTAMVQLRAVPKSHPFAGTQHADNIVTFATARYTPRPLVVQGPGAGAAVTAAGAFADILRAASV